MEIDQLKKHIEENFYHANVENIILLNTSVVEPNMNIRRMFDIGTDCVVEILSDKSDNKIIFECSWHVLSHPQWYKNPPEWFNENLISVVQKSRANKSKIVVENLSGKTIKSLKKIEDENAETFFDCLVEKESWAENEIFRILKLEAVDSQIVYPQRSKDNKGDNVNLIKILHKNNHVFNLILKK